MEERTKDIGRCHNDFCILQERYNKNTDKQIESIQEEIGSVYEHMAERNVHGESSYKRRRCRCSAFCIII